MLLFSLIKKSVIIIAFFLSFCDKFKFTLSNEAK